MRVLFTTTGHAGHVLPLVPFARACMRAGDDVRVAAPRSRGAVVERAGLTFIPVDDPPADETWAVFRPTAGMDAEAANAVVIGEVFGRLAARAALPGLLSIVDGWRPDVIVRESYEFASAIAAEARGIPHVRVATGLAALEEWILGHALAGLGELPLHAIRSSPLLTLTPPALDGAVPAYRFRETLSSARPLPDWWQGCGGPLVYVTFGSVAAGTPLFPGLYRAALDELAELPARVLMTVGDSGDAASLGPLPENVHVERWVPHADAAAEAAAIVCHGGYGTTTGSLSHGVPLVVVPIFADQPHNARRVAEVGAGIARPPFASIDAAATAGLAGLAGEVAQVLERPAYRRAARRVAESALAAPDVAAAPALLEQLAGTAALAA